MIIKKLLFAATTVFLGCLITGSVSAQPSQKILLRSNQEKNILGSKLMIKFVSVVEDSRCPPGQVCVWAGNAKVKIQIRKKGSQAREFEVNSTLEPQTIRYKGYQIKLESLSPRPGENVKAIAAKNTAVFLVTKL